MAVRTKNGSAFRPISGSERRLKRRAALKLGVAACVLLPVAAMAQDPAMPQGASVASGAVSVASPSASNMTITQGSNSAIVNWDSFSIGAGGHVDIRQPSANSTMLNRVTGETTSEIHGRLTANGHVTLVNPNGIHIGPNGAVNTQAFVASTLDIDNGDFNAGRLVFRGAGDSATVRNEGRVTIGRGGYAALLGGKVRNSGIVTVPFGRIGFAAGEQVTLDLSGDGFLEVAVPSGSLGEEVLIDNSGEAIAEGGLIEMRAATARHAVRNAINLSGVAEASSVSVRGGTIVLGGGSGGRVSVTGRASAKSAPWATLLLDSSKRPPVRGGEVTITGSDIALSGAEIEASGDGGGGLIRIGGDFAGLGDLPRSETVISDVSTLIAADSLDAGDGGRIAIWSDLRTHVSSTISARGGDLGGDGGFVEVSGKIGLFYGGSTDRSAPLGQAGTLLLDPRNIQVDTVAGANTTLLELTLENDLGSGPVTLNTVDGGVSEAGTITVNADIDWSSGNQLELFAEGDIFLNGALNGGSATVAMESPGSITLNGAVNANRLVFNNTLRAGAGTITTTAAGAVTVADFDLVGGDWFQVLDPLPAFSATDFTVSFRSSFLRVEGGDGFSGTPYLLSDVYGLQGVATGSFAQDSFRLVDDIDARGTTGWDDFGSRGFEPISGYYGAFDGDGFEVFGLFMDPDDGEGGSRDAGLFSSIDSGGTVQDLTIRDADVTGSSVGILAARNDGTVSNVEVSGFVTGFGDDIGGFVGQNFGTINDSTANVVVTATPNFDNTGFIRIGGFVGENGTLINRSNSGGSVTADNSGSVSAMAVGGFAGAETSNLGGTINDSYSETTVTVTSNAGGAAAEVGGFVGEIAGAINRSFATGSVSVSGIDTFNVGGFAGLDSEGGTQGGTTFWDVNTTGQATSPVGTGLTTAQFQDIETFIALGTAQGWDFSTVWAPGDTGEYPSNYSTEPVVFAEPGALTVQYGLTPTATATGTVAGGPGAFVFDLDGDTLDTTPVFDTLTFPDETVGTRGFSLDNSTLTSADGVSYRVVARQGSADITPAPLELVADDQTKTYGSTFVFAGTEFTTNGTLFFADSVDSATITSGGADGTALVSPSPFDIDINAPVGTGLTNYTITLTTGLFDVTPAPLTITPDDTSKVYGDDLFFDGTEFTTTGTLFNGDAVGSVTLSSGGQFASATVADGPYVIAASNPLGAGLDNYDITLDTGTLTVTPAPLTVTADDASKTYGDVVTFAGTEFTAGALFNDDTLDSVTLTSAGAAGTAPVAGSPYAITPSAPVGSGLANYDISFVDGALDVALAPLAITADDQTKTYGTDLVFAGTEFTVSGTLFNADSVDSLTLSSGGATAAALVADGPFSILASAPVGTGLANYDVTLVDGALSLTAAPLTITANDITKVYGDEVVFAGTEFTTTALFNGDTVDSLDLSSAGAPASTPVAGSPFVIAASNPTGTGLANYTVSVVDGDLTIDPAPLTITADDQSKVEGESFSFDGDEFSVAGLALPGDDVTSVTLTSAGADALASALDSPFPITPSAPVGTGLANYGISFVDGTFVIDVPPDQEIPVPPVFVGFPPPNPPDNVDIGGGGDDGDPGSVSSPGPSGGSTPEVVAAEETLGEVEEIVEELIIGADDCGQSGGAVGRYLACLSDSLNDFAGELDAIAEDLPPGMQNVARIVQDARVEVDQARARAQRRLASATTEAERDAIRADAVNEARSALSNAATEIRKSISLVRADDPELASVQRATVTRVAAAVDNVGIQLARATGL